MRLVGDLEADGLLETITQVWCICLYDIDKAKMSSYGPDELDKALAHMDQADELIYHNGLMYDFPALDMILGWKPKPSTHIHDTQVYSFLLNADRWQGHSLKGWGKFLGGEQKVEHEDWSQFSPEMLHRCESDVRITYRTFLALMDEMER